MWLFCKSGFFSAVAHETKPDTIHLRARFKGDLERLFKAHGLRARVIYTPNNDYAYRANVRKQDWAEIVACEAADIDYTNFKNAVHDGTARDGAYMGAWCAMRDGQNSQLGGKPWFERGAGY